MFQLVRSSLHVCINRNQPAELYGCLKTSQSNIVSVSIRTESNKTFDIWCETYSTKRDKISSFILSSFHILRNPLNPWPQVWLFSDSINIRLPIVFLRNEIIDHQTNWISRLTVLAFQSRRSDEIRWKQSKGNRRLKQLFIIWFKWQTKVTKRRRFLWNVLIPLRQN